MISPLLPLPIEFRGDTFYVFHDYSFIGSKNDKYRLRIIKKAAGAHYFEEMLLGGLPGSTVDAAGDTTGGLFKAGERLYDLQSEGEDMAVRTGDRLDFYLYPNPASEELYVRCNYPAEYAPRPGEPIDARAEFTLYNSLGQAFGAYSSALGGFVKIDATSLQPGLYYIKGRIVSSDYIPDTPAAAVSKPVVIVR